MAFSSTKAALRAINASRALAKKESDSTLAQYLGDGEVPLLPAAAENQGEEGSMPVSAENASEKEEKKGTEGENSHDFSRESAAPSAATHGQRKKERKRTVREEEKRGGVKDPLTELVSFLPHHRRSAALSFLRHLAADSRIHLRQNWIYEGEKKKGHIVAVLAAQFLPSSSAASMEFFRKYKAKQSSKTASVLPTLEKTLRVATGSRGDASTSSS